MYFPYLYGRRAERNALIDVAASLGAPQKVHPIVEPYSPAGDLIKLLDAYEAAGTKLHMVVNPTRGTLQTASEQTVWKKAVSGYIAQPALITPVLHVLGSTTARDIAAFLGAYPKREIALVVLEGGLSPVAVASAIGTRTVRVFVGPRAAVTDYAAAMPNQHVIALVPRFPVLVNVERPTGCPKRVQPSRPLLPELARAF